MINREQIVYTTSLLLEEHVKTIGAVVEYSSQVIY